MMGSECVLCGKVFYNRHYIPEILWLQGHLFIVFRFEMTWSASRNIQMSKHSSVCTAQDESYCTSYSMEQPIFNLVYRRWEHYRLKRTAAPPWKHRAAVLVRWTIERVIFESARISRISAINRYSATIPREYPASAFMRLAENIVRVLKSVSTISTWGIIPALPKLFKPEMSEWNVCLANMAATTTQCRNRRGYERK